MVLSTDDHLEIQRLYGAHCHAVDAGDLEGRLASFTPTGVLVLPNGDQLSGYDEMRQHAEASVDRHDGRLRHNVTNLVVEGADGAAHASCYVLALTQPGPAGVAVEGGEPAEVIAMVHYHDELTHTEVGWKIARRVVSSSPTSGVRAGR